MKLTTPFFNTLITFDDASVQTLVIESPQCLRELLTDITKQLDGLEGDSVLSVDNKPVTFSKYAELIDTFIPFSLNRKTLLTKITALIEKAAVNEEHYLETQELLSKLECYLDTLDFELPCEITYDKLNFSSVVRSVGVSIADDTPDPLEKLLLYMDLVRTLDRDKLFVLFNFRCYYDEKETEAFLHSVLDHKYRVLLIDTFAHPLLTMEHRLTIDRDRCEF